MSLFVTGDPKILQEENWMVVAYAFNPKIWEAEAGGYQSV